jgi:hypothetical protein
VWSWVRKISVVDCYLRDLKAPILPQFLASLPLIESLKKSPPPSSHKAWMQFSKLSPSLKGLAKEMMPIEGFETLPLPSEM